MFWPKSTTNTQGVLAKKYNKHPRCFGQKVQQTPKVFWPKSTTNTQGVLAKKYNKQLPSPDSGFWIYFTELPFLLPKILCWWLWSVFNSHNWYGCKLFDKCEVLIEKWDISWDYGTYHVSLNMHAQLSSGATGLMFGGSLHPTLCLWEGTALARQPECEACLRPLWLHLHGWKFSGLFLNSGFWGWLSTESQPQNAELGRLY